MSEIVAGIDPGLSGAVCFMHADESVETFDIPTLEVGRGGGKKRRDLDGYSLFALLEQHRPLGHVFLEQAQAMPGQSAYATGIFFQVYGEIRGILVAASIPFTVVHPQVWKRSLLVPREKDGARARASQLLPTSSGQWALKKHDGRAEAAMIALWGIRHLETNSATRVERSRATRRRAANG